MRKRNLAGIVAGASVLLGGALYSESRGADVGVGVGLTPYFETSAEDFEPLVFEGVADFSFDALVLDVADLAINFSRKDVKALRNSLESIGRELENGYYEFAPSDIVLRFCKIDRQRFREFFVRNKERRHFTSREFHKKMLKDVQG